MAVILMLIIAGILVAAGFLLAFIWAVRSGQYDDTESPAVRILFDDKPRGPQTNAKTQEKKTS
ncbi:cbb3-type cytochrome oxidase assembly protein CcoS [Eisenibacter elegans]|jgi:cbb3-type cytochrome oxidase maturation protein|uniref:cbb3-type cytochrome oxidase assembly protein CcoS n=1 Tax=Eisenibacter elegans TaxID=997 RepID=UPI00041E6712|nr:cbb3-type cytochrome oxidase assembly protein CcoS [Eisenibacter elegans]